jgi:hypothetical protein
MTYYPNCRSFLPSSGRLSSGAAVAVLCEGSAAPLPGRDHSAPQFGHSTDNTHSQACMTISASRMPRKGHPRQLAPSGEQRSAAASAVPHSWIPRGTLSQGCRPPGVPALRSACRQGYRPSGGADSQGGLPSGGAYPQGRSRMSIRTPAVGVKVSLRACAPGRQDGRWPRGHPAGRQGGGEGEHQCSSRHHASSRTAGQDKAGRGMEAQGSAGKGRAPPAAPLPTQLPPRCNPTTPGGLPHLPWRDAPRLQLLGDQPGGRVQHIHGVPLKGLHAGVPREPQVPPQYPVCLDRGGAGHADVSQAHGRGARVE